MPNCFTLTPKGQASPATLAAVDEGICALLGVEPHPVKYIAGWFDDLGFCYAMGDSHDRVLEKLNELLAKTTDAFDLRQIEVKLKIAQYLADNYDLNAWAEIGRR